MTLPSLAHWFIQSPWVLLALFSLLVPLIIHLLSKSKGKLVPFGNIKLIQLSKPVKMNEVRLVDRFLLLCRLLLLLFSVLLLAQLYYDDRSNSDDAIEGNLLITTDWLNNATEAELQILAAKANAIPTYLLSAEIERLTSDQVFTWKSKETTKGVESLDLKAGEQQNTWLLVNNYAKTLSNNVNINVYSTNRLSQFIGNKVYLPDNITWNIKHLSENKITESIDTLANKALSVVVISDNDNNDYLPALKTALSIIQVAKLKKLTFTFQLSDQFNEVQLQGNDIEKYDAILYLGSLPISAAIKQKVKEGTTLIADIKHSKDNDVTHLIHWHEQITKVTFPSVLMSLLLDESIEHYRMQQQLSHEQITRQLTKNHSSTAVSSNNKEHYQERYSEGYADKFKNESINQLLIILLVLFWSIERLLSERLKKNQRPSDSSSSHELRHEMRGRNYD